jgi:hypothetical protein
MVGGCGCTVTVKLHVAVLHSLLAVQFTVVVPTGKAVPETGRHVTGTPARLAVGVAYVTGVPAPPPPLKGTEMLLGHVIATRGFTSTLKLHVAV